MNSVDNMDKKESRERVIAILSEFPMHRRAQECVLHTFEGYDSFNTIFVRNDAIHLSDQAYWFCIGAGLIE